MSIYVDIVQTMFLMLDFLLVVFVRGCDTNENTVDVFLFLFPAVTAAVLRRDVYSPARLHTFGAV